MERSKANKKKFQMRSPFKGSIAEFMAMGKALGSSKINPSTAVDPSKYYTAPKKQEKEEEESAVDKNKREKAEIEIKDRETKNNDKKIKPVSLDSKMTGPTIDYKGDTKFREYNVDTKLNKSTQKTLNKKQESVFPMKYGRKK